MTILPPSACASKQDYLEQFPSADTPTAPYLSALTPEQAARTADEIEKITAMFQKDEWRKKFRNARLNAGLTQAQAALLISPVLSVRTVEAWELAGQDGRMPPVWTHAFILGQLRR